MSLQTWLTLVVGIAGVIRTDAAEITVGSWRAIFEGVEVADGRQDATEFGEYNHRVMCLRVDLRSPYIELVTTPKCTNCSVYETLAENTSYFLNRLDLQVAVNGAFYNSSTGPNDVPLGTPENVLGLAISGGQVVSPADDPAHAASLMFTADNEPIFLPFNFPGTNTAGLFTAISGDYPLLIDGAPYEAPNPFDREPRTAIGISQDNRYLFLMTLDGRQSGWSDGADRYSTALWLQRFGAWHGINVDGGGSATMVMEDCSGVPQRLNRSSYVYTYGRERYIGHNIGVRARPLSADRKVVVTPGSTTVTLTWQTDFPATTQVEYGLTSALGSASPLDPRLVRNHVVTLAGLMPGTNYYYQATSQGDGGQTFSEGCKFSTRRLVETVQVFGIQNNWRYSTNNYDGVEWKGEDYDDTAWSGPSPALLYVLENNAGVAPRNTLLPPSIAPIPRTYYFRTRFNHSGPTAGVSLTFSNYIDDGAVFYLNGTELYRLRLPPPPNAIVNATSANDQPCRGQLQAGDALITCPDVFTVSGSIVSANLYQGENVLGVEVHNFGTGSDLVFGSVLLKNTPIIERPALNLWMENDVATLFWNGEGFRLQQSSDLSSSQNWSDVPGPGSVSPFTITNSASTFYRLRN